jgi:predicted permease
VTLGIGIGTSVAVFTVVSAILLRPLPVANQGRLFDVAKRVKTSALNVPFSLRDLNSLPQELSPLVESTAGYVFDSPNTYGVDVDGDRFQVNITGVTPNFFSVLGVQPLLGTTSASPSSDGNWFVVISSGLWARRFGRDRSILGKQLKVGNHLVLTVIGVAPSGFDFSHGTEVWGLVAPPPGQEASYTWFTAIVRTKVGVAAATLQTGIQTFVSQHAMADATINSGSPPQVVVTPFLDTVIGHIRPSVVVLLGGVTLLLLTAIGNAAGLMLLQVSRRVRELAIRSAIGAGRARIVRLLVAESSRVAVLATMLGIGLSIVLVRLLLAWAPADIPRVDQVRVDGPALACAIGLTLVSIVLFGLLPALWFTRKEPFESLRAAQSGTRATVKDNRIREIIVVGQVAVATVLVIAAGLVIRTVNHLSHLDLGIQPANLTLILIPIETGDSTARRAQQFYRELAQQIRLSPGVQDAAALASPPFQGIRNAWHGQFVLPGQDSVRSKRNPLIDVEQVDDHYFATLQIPVLKGTTFSSADGPNGPRKVIVSAAFARLAWPDRDPIGQRVILWNSVPDVVIGVVGDTHFRELTSPGLTAYYALDQADIVIARYLAVRTVLSPDAVFALTQRIVSRIDASVKALDVMTIASAMRQPLARPKFNAALLGLFAGLITPLMGIGLFVTISALVAARLREIGIRLALGAAPGRVARDIASRGARIALVGVLAGIALYAAVLRVLRHLLFGVTPMDPATLGLTMLLLLLVTVGSCVQPTLRAARVDPLTSLRND